MSPASSDPANLVAGTYFKDSPDVSVGGSDKGEDDWKHEIILIKTKLLIVYQLLNPLLIPGH